VNPLRCVLSGVFALLALAASAGSCSKSAPERDHGTGPQLSAQQRITLTPADGGSTVPDDFPGGVPLYPGARTAIVTKSGNARGKPAWSITLESDDPKERVSSYYKANMKEFTPASEMSLADTTMSVWHNDRYDVTILVGPGANQKTEITLTVAQR
jgi:hypothetical protein